MEQGNAVYACMYRFKLLIFISLIISLLRLSIYPIIYCFYVVHL